MIRINLLGGVGEGAQSVERRRQLHIVYGVLAANVVAALLASVVMGSLASRREAELATTKRELQSVLKVVHDVQDEERQRAVLREKHRVIADLEGKAVGPLRILTTLSDSTPARLWLHEFSDRAGQVTITGLAIDDPTVAEFLSRLQQSPHFRGLELVETAQSMEGGTQVKKFVMRGPLYYLANGGSESPENGNTPHKDGDKS
jgi:type IV pilus assembly protein PilN